MEVIGLYCFITQDMRYSNRDWAAGGSVFVSMLIAISVPSKMLRSLIKSSQQWD